MIRIRDRLRRIAPDILRNYWGARYTEITWLLLCATADAARQAVQQPWIAHADSPDDAVPRVGAGRGLAQYPAETSDQYRARVLDAWNAYQHAGDEQSIIGQLEAFGLAQTTYSEGWTWAANGLTIGYPSAGVTSQTATAVLADHYLASGIFTPAEPEQQLEYTVRAKANGRDWLCLRAMNSSPALIAGGYFNLATGQVGTAISGASGITPVLRMTSLGDGWYDCHVRMAIGIASCYLLLHAALADSGSYSYLGDGASGFLMQRAASTIKSPPVQIFTPNEWTRAPILHPYTGTAWWSQFWILAPRGTHPYGDGPTITAIEEESIKSIVGKWRPGVWVCQEVLLAGTAPIIGWDDPAIPPVAGGTSPHVITV